MLRRFINFQYFPCALTQGYSKDCAGGQGGAKELKFIEFANVTDIEVTAGVVTGITLATGKRFWKYRPARNTAYGKSTFTANVSQGTSFYAQEVGMALNGMDTNTTLELDKLSKNSLLIAVKAADGKKWLYGRDNGMDSASGESGTGTASADRNGYTRVFTSEEPADAIEIDDATYAALETPGS